MTETAAAVPQEQLCLRTVRQLFDALCTPEASTRLSALEAVRTSPATALSFGLDGNQDVIDVLLQQAERMRGTMEWFSWIGALAAFRDRRVMRLFLSLLTTESHPELLFALVECLRSQDLEALRPQLTPALLQNDCPARARAVAHLLAQTGSESAAGQLRIGLLEEECAPPLFTAASVEWLNELAGPFQQEARCHLVRQSPSVLPGLALHWDQLSAPNREWLLAECAEQDPALAFDLTRQALTGDSATMSIHIAATCKGLPDDLSAHIVPFVSHASEAVRRSAVLCCRELDWRNVFDNESSILVKQACLTKLAESEGMEAISDLLHHLENPDWRIRATASEALVLLGAPAVRAALQLTSQADESVRTCLARMLLELGDEELLNDFLSRLGAMPV